jgi:DNA repair photolyase
MNKQVFGTKEWSSSSFNIQFGCEHNCHYCYAKAMTPRHKKINIKDWANPIINLEAMMKLFGKRSGTIMFPTTHDITISNLSNVMDALYRMLGAGNHVLLVTKPHYDCVKYICDVLKGKEDQILWRFTIGSADGKILKFWEPEAPSYTERLKSLKHAFKKGFQTSVSCEPMLDGAIDQVVEAVRPYITDAVWIGLPNFLIERLKINGAPQEVIDRGSYLLSIFNDDFIQQLYKKYKKDKMVKWKESIKSIVGIPVPDQPGLDV